MRFGLAALFALAACASAPEPTPEPAAASPRMIITAETRCETLEAYAAAGGENAGWARDVANAACALPIDDLTAEAARALLGDAPLHIARDGNALTIFARSTREQPRLCCSLQAPMAPLGDDLWALRFRLAELDRAMLMFFAPDERTYWREWRGPDAPPAPAQKSPIAGQIIERTLPSAHLGETRRLSIYLPPGHRAGGDYAALVMADGGAATFARFIEPLIESGAIEPLVLIGIESGQDGIVEDRSGLGVRGNDLRGADYLPGWEGAGDRFTQHMRFVTDELLPHAEREFFITKDRMRRGVDGFSNGAVFSLWAGVLAPESFGIAIGRSAGYDREMPTQDALAQLAHTRFFISAGLYEPSFWRASNRWAEALRPHAQSVVFNSPAGGHAPDQGALMLVQHVREAFPPR